MTELLLSILSSSILFVLFRLFPKYKVDTAQAIIVNYFTAFVCGCLVTSELPSIHKLVDSGLIPYVLLAGFLFISLFIGMGYSSQKNGMGTTSVAVKMSLALVMIFFIIAYREPVTILKIAGFILAFTGIFLITYEKGGTERKSAVALLLLLFVGSAVLDILLNYVQKNLLHNYPLSIYVAFGFLAAGSMGVIWIIIEFLRKKRTFAWRNIIGGIVLGIPNYFSIYYLVRSYKTTGWDDTVTIAIIGIGIVSLTAITGMAFFRESTRWNKLAGLIAAIVAIIILNISSK